MLQEIGKSFKYIAHARHFEQQKYEPLCLSIYHSSVSENVLFQEEVCKNQT